MIYTYTLVPPSGIVSISMITYRHSTLRLKSTTSIATSLLLSNRQISDEAHQVLYGSTTLRLIHSSPVKMHLFLNKAIRSSTLQMIKSIALEPYNMHGDQVKHWGSLLDTLNENMPSLKTVGVTLCWDPRVDSSYLQASKIKRLVQCRILARDTYYGIRCIEVYGSSETTVSATSTI